MLISVQKVQTLLTIILNDLQIVIITITNNLISFIIVLYKEEDKMKQNLQTARRNLNSPNIKTRKRALKIIKQHQRSK